MKPVITVSAFLIGCISVIPKILRLSQIYPAGRLIHIIIFYQTLSPLAYCAPFRGCLASTDIFTLQIIDRYTPNI